MPCLIAACALLSFAAKFSFGAEVTLLPVADTTLIQAEPGNNMGAHPFVNAGTSGVFTRNRALFKFDPAARIPSGANIIRVELLIEVVGQPPEPAPAFFNLHRVLQDWGEGTKTSTGGPGLGAPASEGEATWNHRFATAQPWASPGAAAETDYVATVSASQIIYTMNESPFLFASTTNLVADVQFWLDNPGLNFGWILITEDESIPFTARRFGAREDPDNATLLEVEFSPPLQITGPQIAGNEFHFSFLAEGGKSYAAEFRDSFSPGSQWTTLTNITAQPETQNALVTDAIGEQQRFYRVIAD